MRVLVTGGAGFIGHHLVPRLVDEGIEVVVFDNLRRGSFERPGLEGADRLEGDIRDGDKVRGAVRGCDVVVHLAAQANVMGSQDDPAYAFTTNVVGTWEVLEAARNEGVRHVVFASSREVYGQCAPPAVREDQPLRPKNLYGKTKTACEALLGCGDQRGPSVSIVRLANVIGAGDSGRVVPLWLSAALSNAPFVMYGGSQVLDFVPVATVVEGLRRLVLGEPLSQPVNIGSGRPTSLAELASRVLEATGSKSPVEVLPARPEEVTWFCADVNRMQEVLGVTPPPDPLAELHHIVESMR